MIRRITNLFFPPLPGDRAINEKAYQTTLRALAETELWLEHHTFEAEKLRARLARLRDRLGYDEDPETKGRAARG